jgi:hypothetical protein
MKRKYYGIWIFSISLKNIFKQFIEAYHVLIWCMPIDLK